MRNCSDCVDWDMVYSINSGVLQVYFSCSVLSVLAVVLVWMGLALVPTLRRHPAQLLFNRTMLDLVICFCHIATYAMNIYPRPDVDFNERCKAISFVFQVAAFGSNGWYFLLSLDLFLVIRNPFCQPKENIKMYYVGLYSVSLVTGLALLLGQQYGLNYFNYCWARSDFTGQASPADTWAWIICLLYGPGLLLSFVSFIIVLFSAYVLRRGLPSSDATRKHALRFTFVCTAALASERVVIVLLIMIRSISWDNGPTPSDVSTLRNTVFMFASLEGLRGVFDAVVWLIAGILSWREVRQSQGKRLREGDAGASLTANQLSVQIQEVSSVLRHDMIRCTSWGIVDSASVSSTNQPLYETFSFTFVEGRNDGHTLLLNGRLQVDTLGRQVHTRRIHCPAALQNTAFDFRDHEPDVFCRLRALIGVDRMTYCHSFSIPDGATSAMVERFTEGKSGSFFYFTQDSQYIVKTVSNSEASLLRSSIHVYCRYLEENPDSLLTRFLGLHAMRLSPEQKFITLVVMENVFPREDHLKPNEKYDLKGSWVGRSALKTAMHTANDRAGLTLKDNDIHRVFHIGQERKEQLMEQLTKDVDFLIGLGIMDYSLLVGVCDLDVNPSQLQPEHRATRIGVGAAFTMPTRTTSLGMPPDLPCQISNDFGPSASAAKCVPWHRQFHGGLLSNPPIKPRTSRSKITSGPSPAEQPEGKWSIFYIGIIDLLQKYDWTKRVERFYKTKLQCMDKRGVSVTRPHEYGQRFLNAVERHFR